MRQRHIEKENIPTTADLTKLRRGGGGTGRRGGRQERHRRAPHQSLLRVCQGRFRFPAVFPFVHRDYYKAGQRWLFHFSISFRLFFF